MGGRFSSGDDCEVRRCLEHPPPELAASVARGERCGHCGRGFWPDMLHLDCPPDEPVHDVAVGCQRVTRTVESDDED
jgi:hypothetical protein